MMEGETRGFVCGIGQDRMGLDGMERRRWQPTSEKNSAPLLVAFVSFRGAMWASASLPSALP